MRPSERGGRVCGHGEISEERQGGDEVLVRSQMGLRRA